MAYQKTTALEMFFMLLHRDSSASTFLFYSGMSTDQRDFTSKSV